MNADVQSKWMSCTIIKHIKRRWNFTFYRTCQFTFSAYMSESHNNAGIPAPERTEEYLHSLETTD